MEIRQVLKSSASMIPVLFYKVSDRSTKPAGEEKYRRGKKREAQEIRGGGEKGWVIRFKQEIRNNPYGGCCKVRGIMKRFQTGRVKAITQRERWRDKRGKKNRERKGRKKTSVKSLTEGVWLGSNTCASLAISKPRLMRQALNSSAPRVPEWSCCVGRRREGGRHRPCSNTYSRIRGGVGGKGWEHGGGWGGCRVEGGGGSAPCTGRWGGGKEGEGEGRGPCKRDRKQRTQCISIRTAEVNTWWQQSCHAWVRAFRGVKVQWGRQITGPPAGLIHIVNGT